MQVFKVAIEKHVTAVMYTQLITQIATRDRAERNFRPLDGQWSIYYGVENQYSLGFR